MSLTVVFVAWSALPAGVFPGKQRIRIAGGGPRHQPLRRRRRSAVELRGTRTISIAFQTKTLGERRVGGGGGGGGLNQPKSTERNEEFRDSRIQSQGSVRGVAVDQSVTSIATLLCD